MPLTDEERAKAVQELYGPQIAPTPAPALPPMTPEQYELMEKIRIERERQLEEQLRRQQLEQERKAVEGYERRNPAAGKTLPQMLKEYLGK